MKYREKLGNIVLGGALVWLLGCALIMEEPPDLEPVEAVFYYDPHSATIASAYSAKLPTRRQIRQVVIHSLDPIRGTDIYVREGEDEWKHVKQIKGLIHGRTPINIRAAGDAVRVIPKTAALGVITNVEVFAVPNKSHLERRANEIK
ncbi:MAG: hypothetical protein OXT74_11905 [Candidatus Poribacteria bacterium]|nr:hypothetical protein [Candidatus Poribacteria bacterium]